MVLAHSLFCFLLVGPKYSRFLPLAWSVFAYIIWYLVPDLFRLFRLGLATVLLLYVR